MSKRLVLFALATVCLGQVAMTSSAGAFTYGGGTTATYVEGETGVVVAPTVTVSFTGMYDESAGVGTISITGGFTSGDVLSYVAPNGNGISISTYNAATGVLTLSGQSGWDSPAAAYWQSAFRAVKFSTTADTPGTTRTIRFTSDDHTQGNHIVTMTLAAGAPNQPLAPSVVAGNQTATITVSPASSGLAARTHLVTASPGGRTCTVSAATGSCIIDGLTNGASYTFSSQSLRLTASSVASPMSLAVTPSAPAPVVQTPAESTPAVLNTPTTVPPPTTVSPPTTVAPTTTVAPIASPRVLKMGKSISATTMAQAVSLKVSRTSVIRLAVHPSTKLNCRITGSRVQGVRSGACKVRVSVATRGTTILRTASLKIVR